MIKFFKDIFTGRDNATFDIGRVLWFQGTQAYIIYSGYALWHTGTFDAITWGGGLAALLGAGGASLGLKSATEPFIDADGNGIPDIYDRLMHRRDEAAGGEPPCEATPPK